MRSFRFFCMLFLVVGLAGCSRSPEWNVLLITMDTTRADHLRCYGNMAIETPALNALAKDGALFERAYTPAPLTMPAHSTIMTGTLPPFHTVRDNGSDRLPNPMTTLAEALKDKGYTTSAFISAAVLKKIYNLNQGFDHWDEEDIGPQLDVPSMLVADRKAEVTTDAVIKWLDGVYTEKFFSWVHYYDPHASYSPPPPYEGFYMLSQYDGEIAYMDSQIRRLLARLEELDVLEKTIVIAIGDHGESLGEHGENSHAIMIYDATQHVPLIIKVPGAKAPGTRVSDPVFAFDVMPTILDLLGIKVPAAVQGRSLKPYIEGNAKDESPRYGYIESEYSFYHYGWSGLKGLIGPQYKFIQAPKPELYDLLEDPQELNNLVDDLPKIARQMKSRLESLERQMLEDPARPQREEAELSEEDRKMLEALGYVGGADRDARKNDRDRDPKDYIHLMPMTQMVNQASVSKDYPLLLKLCDDLITKDDKNFSAIKQRANALFALGRYEEAVQAYKLEIEVVGKSLGTYSMLGNLYLRFYNQAKAAGDEQSAATQLANAREMFGNALTLNPRSSPVRYYLGRIFMEKGEYEQARKEFENMTDGKFSHLGLAQYWQAMGDDAQAEIEYETAIEDMEEPSVPQFFIEYSQFLHKKGHNRRALELLEKTYEYDPSQRVDRNFMQLLNDVRLAIGLDDQNP